MLRHCGAAVAVLALLYGWSAAPYTHAHRAIDSLTDERHPHGVTLVHTHASPHAYHDAGRSGHDSGGAEDRQDQVWSIGSFAFHPPAPHEAPAPAFVDVGTPYVQPAGNGSRADRLQPMAHGPPAVAPPGLRAPPEFLPAFV